MTAEETMEGKKTWTTWEELLLACAVKRHGLKDWDSVAMELQNRNTLPVSLTAQICRNKYHDLKRRFMDCTDDERDDDDDDDEVVTIPWVEDLRKLRVAELQREVLQYDLSIQSLQLKVKRLEEEPEESFKENENDDGKPDLVKDKEVERSENDKKDGEKAPAEASPEDMAGEKVPGEDSDRSFNQSNTSENRETGEKADERKLEPEQVETGNVELDLDSKPVGEDSCNDSSDTVAKHAASKPSQGKKVGDSSTELRDSAAESKEGTKDSSDVQSSASLTKKWRQRREVSGGGVGGEEPVVSPAPIKRDLVKSEPLVGFLDIIRSHKHGSMFERRLESQKTEKYKNMVRQHVDVETVQTRIDDGSYSSCTTKFYVDLLLLFNNAIVFFPKASAESVAAHELRHLVMKELKNRRIGRQSDPSPEAASVLLQPKPEPEKSDSLLAKHKSSVPIVVCRKRSSITVKANSSSSKAEKEAVEKPVVNPKPPVKSSSSTPNEEEEGSMKLKGKEKPVTGARSMRRSSNGRTNSTSNPNKNQITNSSSNPGSTAKGEPPKAEKKKAEVTAAVKKSGAADFLKRIKKNSLAKGTLLERLKKSADEGNVSSKRDQQKKKVVDERKDGMARLRSGTDGSGGGGGKKVKEESSPSKRSVGRPPKKGKDAAPAKRGRDGGEAEAASKRPKKRTRR